ncbi:MAG: LTA synthase family protein [Pelosinus sp.]|nr:LTA synthase family protein [Pelosinus sp.]
MASGYDIGTALWIGLRISCKSAGWLTLFSFSGSILANVFSPRREMAVYKLFNGISIVVLSILYVARFPYYQQFHSSFNQLMFNTLNEDVYALLVSLVKEFDLPVRLSGAFLLAFLLYRLFNQWLAGQPLQLKIAFPLAKWFGRAAFLVLLYFGVTLAQFGGSLGWANEVDWENAGVTKDSFLNEAILDDVQAVWRGYRLNSRLEACSGMDFDVEQIRALAAQLTHKEAAVDNLDEYLQKKAHGPLVTKPQQIFIIVSASYANWPLLEKYKDLHIADGMKGIMAESDSDYCSTFLPNGPSTVSALTGIVTGFANANLYLTTMPEAYASPYSTASAPQLAKLGYKTNFWYAGPSTWERIGDFTTAQGYEHFYSRADFAEGAPGSVWGCDDKYLYEAVLNGVSPDQPSFNVILSVSNHSPFTVDTAQEGFDKNSVIQALPEDAKKDEALVNQLGHYWYADKMQADFIHAAKAKYPDSLFIIIGDHADRYNIAKSPSMYERYGIPFIVTGKNVKKGMLPPDAAGSQIDVVPTLLEMIAPKDFTYYSLGTSLTRGNKQGVNYAFWITHDYIGKTEVSHFVPEPIGNAAPPIDDKALRDYIDAIESISWWRAKYGPVLDGNLAAK